MTDPLRPLRVLDALGAVRSLDQAVQSLVTLPLFAEPFEHAAIAVPDSQGVLRAVAHAEPPATVSAFTEARIWDSPGFKTAVNRTGSSVLVSADDGGPNGSFWLLPVRSPSGLVGVVAGWLPLSLPPTGLGPQADTILSAGFKRVIRAFGPSLPPAAAPELRAAS